MRPFIELSFRGQARRLRPHALRLLEDSYGIREARLRQLTAASNIVYRVERPDGAPPTVLRLTAPKSCHGPGEIRSELAWIDALAEDLEIQFLVPRPLPTTDGAYVVSLEADDISGRWHAALFRWVPGPMLAERLIAKNIELHGRTAAALHAHARRFTPPPWFHIRRYDDPFAYSSPEFRPSEPIVLFGGLSREWMPPNRKAVFQEVHDRVRACIQTLHKKGTPRVIHNDLHIWNVKIAGRTPCVLDFEDLLWGFPVQDLATTLYYYRYREHYEERLDAFRRGYERLAPWPTAESTPLETLIAGRALLLANYVAASEDAEDRTFAPEYLGRVEKRFREFLEASG
jgi:Ser/Thr protein kinase RdoA (MazF antagonist)